MGQTFKPPRKNSKAAKQCADLCSNTADEVNAMCSYHSNDTCGDGCFAFPNFKTDKHIDVELDIDELDLTTAESKATYEEIKDYVLKQSGLKVSNVYIAQVKQKYGIIERVNYNLPKSENFRQTKSSARERGSYKGKH